MKNKDDCAFSASYELTLAHFFFPKLKFTLIDSIQGKIDVKENSQTDLHAIVKHILGPLLEVEIALGIVSENVFRKEGD